MNWILILTLISQGSMAVDHIDDLTWKDCHRIGEIFVDKMSNIHTTYTGASYQCVSKFKERK